MQDVEDRIEQLQKLIRAAEDWAKSYDKDPESKAKLIKNEIKLEADLRRYFRNLSTRTKYFINWGEYSYQVRKLQAASNDVLTNIIIDNVLDDENNEVMKVIFDPLANATALGAQSAQTIYKINLGLTHTSELIQQAAKEKIAELVGKKITPEGLIINNPKAKYSINDKTLDDIRHSISSSLSLGENEAEATQRLVKTIKNPSRAATIARTESVNSYQNGIMTFGKESGALGKQWQTVGAVDACQDYADLEIVEFDYEYDAGVTEPAAHPNCRCGIRLVYSEEFNRQ
jgi:hypothetical protein